MKRRRGRGEEKKKGGEKGEERKEGGKSLSFFFFTVALWGSVYFLRTQYYSENLSDIPGQ